uniref:Uncharacterized protein n=1 Tax=Strombidium inclinatum TaxID=197538 RepID=A0A7S3IZH6_9SPIT|mmetsp:Transcript_8487/g.13002  ORF Transcript_8487/g.13002 Transcript_8487/m.13002 type:complete len:159 (+) Transcript_8487:1118-1594(+)
MAKTMDKFKKINIVNDQISGWAKRCFDKFASLTNDPSLGKKPEDITEVFEVMERITVAELQQIKESDDVGMEDPIDVDFDGNDFLNKNIRVRPVSGMTVSNMSNHSQKGAPTGEEDNYDKLAVYEIEDQRKLAKKRAADYQEELRRKQALEEKKANKK